MTHTYKSETLTKQPDGRWIVNMRNGVMTQHPTLEDAQGFIDLMQVDLMGRLVMSYKY